MTNNLRRFWQAGHLPTLCCAFLYFDVSFMVWILLGAIGNHVAADFGLSTSQKGLMVALPLLGGAALRLVLGPLVDLMGAKRTGQLGLLLTLAPLLYGWRACQTLTDVYLVGLLLGVAGASFAVALPLASRWYPPEFQGLALGIAGAGNSGTVLATLFAPRLAEAYGWRNVFGLALLPVLACLVVFSLLTRECPGGPRPEPLRKRLAILMEPDLFHFGFMYAITFGGFVGLASFLTIFYHDLYGLEKVRAGDFAALCIVAGSLLRPLGGYLADRYGGATVLARLYLAATALLVALSFLPPLGCALPLVFGLLALLGMGNGAVFQLVPLRFRSNLGTATGIIGAAGGVGGFFLPFWLGLTRDLTGSYGTGLAILACVAMGGAALLFKVRPIWQRGFLDAHAGAGVGS